MDRLLPWLRRSGWAYALAALALILVGWRVTAGRAPATQPGGAAPVAIAEARDEQRSLVVHVAGAVRKPGVYRVPHDARVNHAVRLAGGAKPTADLSTINLAAKLEDGQQVVVMDRAVSAGPEGAGAGAAPTTAGPVRLSSATAEQLDTLDGIGPTLAARIVAWRAQNGGFRSIQQLLEVPGIGQARLEALRGKVVP